MGLYKHHFFLTKNVSTSRDRADGLEKDMFAKDVNDADEATTVKCRLGRNSS